jgi:transposase/predicted XRE-type DNA-binding protein
MLTVLPAFRVLRDNVVVAYNFVPVDREQVMLMPPSVADWLPEDHFAWFVIEIVDELDLSAFFAAHRDDGRGGAAYHPAMMLGLLVYAYSIGERSSRRIEQRCVEDVAFRVVAANQHPDHATIARFRAAHGSAIAGLFGQVLAVCAKAGVLRPGLLAIDGTKLAANASRDANRTAEQLAEEILKEAVEVDATEDAAAAAVVDDAAPDEVRSRGRKRRARLKELLAELEAETADKSYESHMARRAEIEAETGRPMRGRRPTPDSATHRSRRQANTTDPDSRLLKVKGGYVQGFNAQAVATVDQWVVAAVVTNRAHDADAFVPMIAAAKANLRRAGERRRVRTVVADAGYWSTTNVKARGVEAIIAPGRSRQLHEISEQDKQRGEILTRIEKREIDTDEAARVLGVTRARVNQLLRVRRRGDDETLTTTMVSKLDTQRGQRLYKKRAAIIEPVFAHIKHNRGIRNLTRRGLPAVDSEWKLITATHNLLKLWRITPAGTS